MSFKSKIDLWYKERNISQVNLHSELSAFAFDKNGQNDNMNATKTKTKTKIIIRESEISKTVSFFGKYFPVWKGFFLSCMRNAHTIIQCQNAPRHRNDMNMV